MMICNDYTDIILRYYKTRNKINYKMKQKYSFFFLLAGPHLNIQVTETAKENYFNVGTNVFTKNSNMKCNFNQKINPTKFKVYGSYVCVLSSTHCRK